jgi:alpha-1,2-glucosyltransferase
MAQFVRIAHANPILLVRGISVLLGAAGVLVFARCRRLLGNGDRDERVLQFALCPIIFPYFFLIYTDVASLLLILVGVWLALERRYALCALALTASLQCARPT